MATFGVTPAFAEPTSAEVQAEADAAAARLEDYQHQLDMASDAYVEAMDAHDAAVAARDEAQATIEQLQGHLGTRANSMYKTGSSSMIDVLLGATTFDDFANTWGLLNNLNAQDVADVEATKVAKAEYDEQEAIAADKLAEAEQIQADAQRLVEQTQAEYDSLSAEAAELLEQERAAAEAAAAAAAAEAQAQIAAGGGDTYDATQNYDSGSDGGSSSSSGSSGSSSSSSDSGGDAGGVYEGGSTVVERAYSCIGAPYQWGAVGPGSYDCSGLVSYCISGSHARIFTSASLMGYAAVSDPQPGDVAVKTGHTGIYIGGGSMIHAPTEGQTVCIAPVQSGMKIVRP